MIAFSKFLKFNIRMVVFNLSLVRHGETGHNKDRVIQGQLDIPLSSVGEKQCELLGQRLQNQKFSHIYTSDLKRARQTAEIILKHNTHFTGDIIEDSRLRERKFGEVEGKPAHFFKEAAMRAKTVLWEFTPPGAETPGQVYDRVVDFFKDLCAMVQKGGHHQILPSNPTWSEKVYPRESEPTGDQPTSSGVTEEPNILVVAHGGSLKELTRHFLEELHCAMPGGLRITPNSGLSRFTITFDENLRPLVSCQAIHDQQHLLLH